MVLRKTAFSANIKERRDYSCAVYDADGETVAHGRSHAGASRRDAAVGARTRSTRSDLQPGRRRDPQRSVRGRDASARHHGGVRGFSRRRAKPSFYVANRAHHADVGGMSPGSMPLAREIYQEGLRIPPILLVRGGRIDRDLLRDDSGQRPHARGTRRRPAGAADVHRPRRAAAARDCREVWRCRACGATCARCRTTASG